VGNPAGTMMVGVGGTSKIDKVHHSYKCGNLIYKKTCNKKTVQKAGFGSFSTATICKAAV
jgi:hypothetical protein